jgi:hypothetical protein
MRTTRERICKRSRGQVESLHFTLVRYEGVFTSLPSGDSSPRAGGRHPLRSAARTIRSITTRDPRCWRFASRNSKAASTSATRLAGTEISRCPPFPLSDRRVIFISSPYIHFVYTVYHTALAENTILLLSCYLHVYTICGMMSFYSRESPFSAILACL